MYFVSTFFPSYKYKWNLRRRLHSFRRPGRLRFICWRYFYLDKKIRPWDVKIIIDYKFDVCKETRLELSNYNRIQLTIFVSNYQKYFEAKAKFMYKQRFMMQDNVLNYSKLWFEKIKTMKSRTSCVWMMYDIYVRQLKLLKSIEMLIPFIK